MGSIKVVILNPTINVSVSNPKKISTSIAVNVRTGGGGGPLVDTDYVINLNDSTYTTTLASGVDQTINIE